MMNNETDDHRDRVPEQKGHQREAAAKEKPPISHEHGGSGQVRPHDVGLAKSENGLRCSAAERTGYVTGDSGSGGRTQIGPTKTEIGTAHRIRGEMSHASQPRSPSTIKRRMRQDP